MVEVLRLGSPRPFHHPLFIWLFSHRKFFFFRHSSRLEHPSTQHIESLELPDTCQVSAKIQNSRLAFAGVTPVSGTHPIPIRITLCTDNSHITQALTNHGRFPSYFRRFNIKECTCRCGEDTSDDALHYIYHCPLVTHLRNRISPSHSLPQIISDIRMAQELGRIINFVNSHQDDILQLDD
ncbi:hypothetical protein AVEN_134502-1 [Araneus ventricosus]|uniref:Uncharacterized protein n=1 Tax=Araneus ventricosus TaxID=182803 RepID=A0A4Y2UH13_ARAVE|nr:hypothetical protein AVEN_134502-1 [Araneus ventricosus]